MDPQNYIRISNHGLSILESILCKNDDPHAIDQLDFLITLIEHKGNVFRLVWIMEDDCLISPKNMYNLFFKFPYYVIETID